LDDTAQSRLLLDDEAFQLALSHARSLQRTLDGAYSNISKESYANEIANALMSAIQAQPEEDRHAIAWKAAGGYGAAFQAGGDTLRAALQQAAAQWRSFGAPPSLCNYLVPALARRALDADPGSPDFATVDALLSTTGVRFPALKKAHKVDATDFLAKTASLSRHPDLFCALLGAAHAYFPLMRTQADGEGLLRAIRTRAARLDVNLQQLLMQELTKLSGATQQTTAA
jgi:hypothetical protein